LYYFPYITIFTAVQISGDCWNILSVYYCIDGGIYFPYIVVLMVEYTFRILLYLLLIELAVTVGGILFNYKLL
jgi:hypothetical protein